VRLPGKTPFLAMALVLLLSGGLMGQEETDDAESSETRPGTWQINGYLENENFLMPDDGRDEARGQYLINKFENHAFMNIRFGSDTLHARGAIHAYVYPSDRYSGGLKDRIAASELYIRRLSEYSDIKIGRQVIRWGTADFMNPTSCFSPMDLSELIFRDEDELYLGVDAVSCTFIAGDYSLQLVLVPVSTASRLPGTTSPWKLTYPDEKVPPEYVSLLGETVPVDYAFTGPDMPPEEKNMSFGGRLTGNISGVDFSVSGYHGLDRDVLLMPVITGTRAVMGLDVPDKVTIMPQYRRVTSIGIDFAWAMEKPDISFQGEASYSFDKAAIVEPDIGLLRPSSIETSKFIDAAAGINWLIDGEDFTIILEYHRSMYLENSGRYIDPFISDTAVFNGTKKFFHSALAVEFRFIYNTGNRDWLLDPRVGYDFQNGFSVEGEAAFFGGDGGTLFGIYRSRDIVRLRAKYSF